MNERLIKILKEDNSLNKSIPFWSWNNELDEEYLVSQIEDMKKAGIGGFIMHARTGLKTEYLGEKWFSCIKACLAKAKELNMKAWIYDENGWPSGFVGGKLLENVEFRAKFLEYKEGSFDSLAFATFVKDDSLGYRRVTSPIEDINEYFNVYLKTSPANTDILNPLVVDSFIKETHEKYYERFSDSFGNELEGFFTDEPQYYRWATPYSPIASNVFEENGKDIKDGLIWLFKKDERGYEFRYEYFKVLNKLYNENFYKRIYEWCKCHNCKLTGHTVEEPELYTQMWGGASVMPTYEYEDIPAIDCLGYGYKTELAQKQVGSVASQLGKKYVLTETFACSGYDVTPKELKGLGENQYFYGVNITCQHLYPYSIAGRGKIDHPPIFGKQSNWFDEFKTFNDYFTKLGTLIANTSEVVDIAILHPIRNVWLDYIRVDDYNSVRELEDSFKELLDTLRKNGITYHLVDEAILERYGKVEDNKLIVGNCSYDTLLIPKMKNIAKSTYEILKKYTGKLCLLSKLEYINGKKESISIEGNTSLSNILSSGKIGFYCDDGLTFITTRKSDLGDFIFVKNMSKDKTSHIEFKDVADKYVSFDIMNYTVSNISNRIDIKANDSLILIRDDSSKEVLVTCEEEDITDSFKVVDISDNYLVLDYAMISKDGEDFTNKRPINGLFEDLLREDYKGIIFVKQEFKLNDKVELKLIFEKADYKTFKVNGKDIEFKNSDFDVNFIESNISDLVKEGVNEIVYSFNFYEHDGVNFALFDPLATESLRNCLYYDTSIEQTYLKGRFIVEEDLSISKTDSLPCLGTNMYKKGYPFFKGELTLEGTVNIDNIDDISLNIDGRYLVANVYVNGSKIDYIWDDSKDISRFLNVGYNTIKIVVKSSLRNLFGPFHYNGSLEWGVGPYNFDFRNNWIDGSIPSNYTHDYKSVDFGVDSINIIRRVNERN